MAEEKLLPADALKKNAPKVIPPLAGFWFRLGAIVIDVILLCVLARFLLPILRPFYLSLGTAAFAVELFLIFLYLFLAEGPVGRGKTVGKALLGIRTTDLQGEPIRPGAAAVRAALLTLIAIRFLPETMEGMVILDGKPSTLFAFRAVIRSLPTAYIIANVFLAVLDPFKQAIHDRAAKTIVVREAGEHNLAAFLEAARGQSPPLVKRATQVATIAFFALGALNVWAEYQKVYSDTAKRGVAFAREFDREFAYEPFRVRFYGPGIPFEGIERLLSQSGETTRCLTIHPGRGGGAPTEPTTDSFSLVFLFRSHSAIADGDYGTTEQMAALLSRAVSWSDRRIVDNLYPLDRASRIVKLRGRDKVTTRLIQPTYVTVMYIEQTDLILVRSGQARITRAELVPLTLPKEFYAKEREAVQPKIRPAGDKATTAPIGRKNARP